MALTPLSLVLAFSLSPMVGEWDHLVLSSWFGVSPSPLQTVALLLSLPYTLALSTSNSRSLYLKTNE